VCVLHAAEITGPAKTLAPRLELLAQNASIEVLLPGGEGGVDVGAAELCFAFATTTRRRYRPLTRPRSPVDALRFALGQVAALVGFAFLFARRRPDAVIVGSTYLPAALVAARSMRIPTLVYSGELLEPASSVGDRMLARLTDACADTVVACSETASKVFRNAVVIRPGVASPRRVARDVAREQLGVPQDAWCVASVGSLTRGRGQDVLLRAVAKLDADVVCLVVGEAHPRTVDRDYAAELRRLVAGLDLERTVRLTGFVSDVDIVYSAADVVVNPARFAEPFGRVAVEALAAGKPVVASAVGAIPEVLEDGVSALLVPPDEPARLAAALERLRDDPDLGRALVMGGADAVARSDVAEGAARFVALVEALLGSSVRGRRGRRRGPR